MKKQVLSLLLALLMVFSLLPISMAEDAPENANPIEETIQTSKTQSEAVEWARAQIWKALDYDGIYGCQCVDLIYYYYAFLGESPRGGHASDYASNSLPSGWNRYIFYNGFVAQPGDIAVWTDGDYGHVAIVESADSSGMTLIQQNFNNKQYVTEDYRAYYVSWGQPPYCFIRPNFAQATYTLTINGYLNGQNADSISGYGTFDLYLNDQLSKSNLTSYSKQVPAGTTYAIKLRSVVDGKSFRGYQSGARTGTVNANTTVRMTFNTVDAKSWLSGKTPQKKTYNGHEYWYYADTCTWYAAKTICEYLGGHLVTISDNAENNTVYALSPEKSVWIGATDIEKEGTWKWITGEPFSYTNWKTEEPSNHETNDEGAENYLIQYLNGGMSDVPGCWSYGFVCEIEPATYTVSYDANGGKSAPAAQTKTAGETLTLSSTKPTRDSAPAGTYTVSFNANGGKVETTALTTAVTANYTFKNWNTAKNGSGTSYSPGGSYTKDESVTLYAQWNSGTTAAAVQLPEPYYYGYYFRGWATSSTAASGVTGSYTPTGNVTLYAIWEKEDLSGWRDEKPDNIYEDQIETATEYRYSDRASDWIWEQTASGTIDYVESWPAGYDKNHSTYSRYNKTPKAVGENGDKKVDATTVENGFLYWHWCRNILTDGPYNRYINDCYSDEFNTFHAFYSTYDAGHSNGTVSPEDCYYFPTADTCTESYWWYRINVYKQTYTEFTKKTIYGEWSDWSCWTMIQYPTGDTRKAESKTVYRYKDSVKPFTVTFNPSGGNVSPASKSVIRGEMYGTLPTPTRMGYTFDGWYTAASGGSQVISTSRVTSSSAHTLYAHWTAINYTVTFDANGGSVSPSSKTVTYGSTYGDLPTPTRTDYSFTGWYTEANGGTKVTSSTTVTVTSDHILYAHWKKNAEPTPIEGAKIEWNGNDVQFNKTTPYVLYNGKAQTPRFVVKNKAGDIIDSQYYSYEFKENTLAGTAYLFVTFRNGYTGSCDSFFKIYLPATKQTTVENVKEGIKITWAPVEGAAGYVIYRRAWSSTTNGWTSFERWWNVTETTWTDGTIENHMVYAGTRYQYGIKAYFAKRLDPISGDYIGGNENIPLGNWNLGIVGPLRTTVRITTRVLNEVVGDSKQITVKWTPSKNFTGYEVQIATNSSFTENVKTVKIDNWKIREQVFTGLKSKKTYYARVRSYHEFEGFTYYGEWSNVLSAKTK